MVTLRIEDSKEKSIEFYRPGFSLLKLAAEHPRGAIFYLMRYLREKYILTFLKEKKIRELTGASLQETRLYFNDLKNNVKLQRHIQDAINKYAYPIGGMTTLRGPVLYVICRVQKPAVVVETGVASGVSSTFILQALGDNKKGKLFSIDLPDPNLKNNIGWLIPKKLRPRWRLTIGRSSEELVPLLDKLGSIDMFLHDSEHSYNNMIWEYRTAWYYLSQGGILLSDDITSNHAFFDFSRKVKRNYVRFNLLGGIRR